MHLLYCDETNFEKRSGNFFVYGGIAIPEVTAASLDESITELRHSLNVPRDYLLKFNPGPENLAHNEFIALKRGVMAATRDAGCSLLVNLVLHDISTSSDEARRFGINTLCFHFDCMLNRENSKGVVLIDRCADREVDGQLRERAAVGLTGPLPYSNEMPINHILGYHYSAIGQSHFCSVVDVVLGSLRFAVNCFTQRNDQKLASAKAILQQLAPIFYRNNDGKVSDISVWFSPKQIKVDRYRAQYEALVGFLEQNGINLAQSIY